MLPARTESSSQLAEQKRSGHSKKQTRQSHDGCLQAQKLNRDNMVDGEERLNCGESQNSDVVAATDDDLAALEHRHTESMGPQKPAEKIYRKGLLGVREQSHEDVSELVLQSDAEPTDFSEEENHVSEDSEQYACNTDTDESPPLLSATKESDILNIVQYDHTSALSGQPSPTKSNLIQDRQMYDLSQLDDRGVVRSFEKLGSEIHRFSLPFYASDKYNHKKLVQGLENLELYKKLVQPSDSKYYRALKKCLKHKSARRSFIDGLVWVALTTWVFDSYPEEASKIQDRISALWNILEEMPQKPLPTEMADRELSTAMIVYSNTHTHQSVVGISTKFNLDSIFQAAEAWGKILSRQKDKFIIRSDINNEKPQRPLSKLCFLTIPGLDKQMAYDGCEVDNTECVAEMKLWKKQRKIRKALRPVATKLKEERKTVRKVLDPVTMKLDYFVLITSKRRETLATKFQKFKNSSIDAKEKKRRKSFQF